MTERESRVDSCCECCKEGDFSLKSVFHCELCDKWLCEKHVKPKFPFFVDWDTIFDVQGDREIKVMFYVEYQREGGHPDFVYWHRKFEALDFEEKQRNELIKKAIDRMMRSNEDEPRTLLNLEEGRRINVERLLEEEKRLEERKFLEEKKRFDEFERLQRQTGDTYWWQQSTSYNITWKIFPSQ